MRVIEDRSRSLIIGHRRNRDEARSTILIREHDLVLEFENRQPSSGSTHIVNSGIYFLKASDLRRICNMNLSGEISDNLISLLIQMKMIDCKLIEYKRVSVDSLKSYSRAIQLFLESEN